MSHHIDVNFSVLPAGKDPVSKKLQQKNAETASAKKRENKKLDIDNKQMEWRLHQLKKAMEKEKEERGKHGFIWQSGKANVALESHARNTLGHSVKTSGKSTRPARSPTKPKVKILKDEPLDIQKRPNHTKHLIGTLLKEENSKLEMQTSSDEHGVRINKETWISISLDPTQDDIMEMQSDRDGNLPLSALTAIEPNSIGVYFKRWGRKRLLLAVDGKVMKPKQGWGSEVYYPYIGSVSPVKPPPNENQTVVVRPPAKRSPPNKVVNNSGGKLFEGTFNEEESAESFKQAVMEWRSKSNRAPEKPQGSKDTVEMSVHAVQSDPVPIDIQFSETSTLSFMERLLLKKHRTTDVPPLPDASFNSSDDNYFLQNEDMEMTEEEQDEHERIRQLFTSQQVPFSNTSLEDTKAERTCLITELEDSGMIWDENIENGSHCFIEEVDEYDANSAGSNPSKTSIVIEEIKYDENYTEGQSRAKSSYQPQVKVASIPTNLPTKKPVTTPRIPKRAIRCKSAGVVRRNERLVQDKKRPQTTATTNRDTHPKTPSPVGLVSVISRLPTNPDAVYNHGLGEFFNPDTNITMTNSENQPPIAYKPSEIMLCNQENQFWKPFSSLSIENTLPDLHLQNTSKHKSQSRIQAVPLEEDKLEAVIEMEREDANTLDALEWELASQTGNITSDGRISRLIDDWSSEEEDLGIINDPGLGSGLSTPEVDQKSLGSAMASSRSWQPQNDQDLVEMENLMMSDLRNESDSEEEEI